MEFYNLVRQYQLREKEPGDEDDKIAKMVLMEYSEKYELLSPINGHYMSNLLSNYFLVKNTEKGKFLERIMNQYNFNYAMSIHNAIYNLLGREHDLRLAYDDPLLWPGVESIENEGNCYILKTVLGEIKVSKASDLFQNTNSEYIFNKYLMGKCHERSYDFIKENKNDYRVILSYMPNFFSGGYYHTYLENDTSILDIAANSYYVLKEDSSKILNGTIIKKLNYNEIEKIYKNLYEKMPQLRGMDREKLLTITLYFDYINSKKI